MADRIFATADAGSRRTLLSDARTEFTGARFRAYVEDLRRPIEQGSTRGGRVGVRFENSAVLAATILAIVALGRVPVVLSPKMRDLAGFRLDLLVSGTDPASVCSCHCGLVRVARDGTPDVLRVAPVASGGSPVPPPGTAVILYTSGSEGEPKGVQLSREAIAYTVSELIDRFELDESAVSVSMLPLHHTMGLNTQLLPTFFAGGRSVFVDTHMGLGSIYRSLLECGGTFVGLVAELLVLCRDERARRGLPAAQRMRQVQLAGGPIRAEHLALASELFPNAVIHRAYGLTEAIRVAQSSSDEVNPSGRGAMRVLPRQRVEIRDEEGRTVPRGIAGRIVVKGPNVMLGYEHGADGPGPDGFLDTGDVGELEADGRLVVHGRRDSFFKVDGERVSATEVERVGVRLLSGVRDARCLPVERDVRVRPVLFLECDPLPDGRDLQAAASSISRALRSNLDRAAYRPQQVFVMPRFPRTSNGKIDLDALKRASDGAGDGLSAAGDCGELLLYRSDRMRDRSVS